MRKACSFIPRIWAVCRSVSVKRCFLRLIPGRPMSMSAKGRWGQQSLHRASILQYSNPPPLNNSRTTTRTKGVVSVWLRQNPFATAEALQRRSTVCGLNRLRPTSNPASALVSCEVDNSRRTATKKALPGDKHEVPVKKRPPYYFVKIRRYW